MVLSGHGINLYVKFAVLFLLACILLLFTAAAVVNSSSVIDDDDAHFLKPASMNSSSTG